MRSEMDELIELSPYIHIPRFFFQKLDGSLLSIPEGLHSESFLKEQRLPMLLAYGI